MEDAGILSRVMDALDLETFLVSSSEEEGKDLALRLMRSLGFQDVDLVYSHFAGTGTRIRARAYIYRPGQDLGWLKTQGGSKAAKHVSSIPFPDKGDMEIGEIFPPYLLPKEKLGLGPIYSSKSKSLDQARDMGTIDPMVLPAKKKLYGRLKGGELL